MPVPSATAPPSEAASGLAELERLSVAAGQLELGAEIRRVAGILERKELTVAVLGQFKRGKSSLLNALAGYPALPTGVLPTTSVATCLVRGSPGLRVFDASGRSTTVPISTVSEYVSEQRNPGNARGISRVEVSVPLPAWTEGVTFVDSPGVGSAHDANTQAAQALLPTVDAAVFVLSPDPPITSEELAFLQRAREFAAKFLFVVNKIDLVEGPTRAELVDYLRRLLRDRCGFGEVRLFLTSARAVSPSRASGPASADGSGVPELLQALQEHFGSQRSETVRLVTSTRVAQFGARLGAQIELALRTANLSEEARSEALRRLAGQVDELRTEHRAFQALLAEEVRSQVASLPARIDRLRRSEEGTIVDALRGRLDALEARTAGGLASAFDRELRERIVPVAAEMRRIVTEESSGFLQGQADRLERRLDRWSEQLRAVVAREFGVDLPPLSVEVEPLGPALSSDRVEALFEGTLLGQTVLFLPAGTLRSRLKGRLEQIVDRELEAQAGRIRSDLAEGLARAWRLTQRRFSERLERDLTLVEEAVRAGQASDEVGARTSKPWRSTMEQLRAHVGEVVRAASAESAPR